MAKRVYIDTSVVGGQFDKEFSVDTVPFFEAELLRAPQQVKDFLASLPSQHIENIRLTQEAGELADQYHSKGGWTNKSCRLPTHCYGDTCQSRYSCQLEL